jgi:hypothetical protein
VAIQWVEVTTPKVPSISGRVVNGLGLMLFIGLPPAAATADLTSFRRLSQSRFRQFRHGRNARIGAGSRMCGDPGGMAALAAQPTGPQRRRRASVVT